MKKLDISEPVIVSQSTTEPVFGGGWQDPMIHCDENGVLFIRFSGRFDDYDAYGREDANPLFRSDDGGKTWTRDHDLDDWVRSVPPLPNGEKLLLREHPCLKEFPPLPELPPERKGHLACCIVRDVYTVDELTPILHDKVAKEFAADRILPGSNEVKLETCKVIWKNMPVHVSPGYLLRVWPNNEYRVDPDGVLWMPVQGAYVAEDGSCPTKYCCIHLLRSDDLGHTWEYVSTVPYLSEYGKPGAFAVEGFIEASLEILKSGRMFMLLRSGSLFPFPKEDEPEKPAPSLLFTYSDDHGKTWSRPFEFYDYGVRPCSVMPGDTLLMTSGRPGVYLRASNDPDGLAWGDVIPLLSVPEEDRYRRYYEYSCANNGICKADDHTAFVTYSDFTRTDEHGVRAKSIVVRKITLRD